MAAMMCRRIMGLLIALGALIFVLDSGYAGAAAALVLTITAGVALQSSRQATAALSETQQRFLSVEREMLRSANALGEAQMKIGRAHV